MGSHKIPWFQTTNQGYDYTNDGSFMHFKAKKDLGLEKG
jgi:hypothetical protein